MQRIIVLVFAALLALVVSACSIPTPEMGTRPVGSLEEAEMAQTQAQPADAGPATAVPTEEPAPTATPVVAPTPMAPATPVVAVPGDSGNPDQTATVEPWKVDQSPPNIVWYYGCEVIAGIQPDYNMGQCIWRTRNPSDARSVWVPGAYIANGGTNGQEEYGPCTFAGTHAGLSFTLPTNVVLTEDQSLWNWEPPKCQVDTSKEWDQHGNPISRDQTQSNTGNQTGTGAVSTGFPPCPDIADFKLNGQQDEFGGCPYVTTVAGGANFNVPENWWGYTTHRNYPPGNAGKQGGVTLYPGAMPN